ncbi:MAG: hypothetical protein HQ483_07960 [Rhodospirillales bacterium]|nr:hypothetical protein [Rhodospirillales bacterium]
MNRYLQILLVSGCTALLLTAFVWFHGQTSQSLRGVYYYDGWILAVALIFLGFFFIRKSLRVLPLIDARFWRLAHLVVGLISVVVFLFHAGTGLPSGWLEGAAWTSFVVTALSGVLGWLMTRTLPAQLDQENGRILFSEFPVARKQLAKDVDALVLKIIEETGDREFLNAYQTEWYGFFSQPLNQWSALFVRRPTATELLAHLDATPVSLGAGDRENLNRLRTLIAARGTLDAQYRRQVILRGWLFIHLSSVFALMVFSLTHILIVYAFSMGTP